MYFLYLDETGTSNNENHFILGGIIVHSNDWKKINEKITNLKKEHFHSVYVDLKGLRRNKKKFLKGKKPNPFFSKKEDELREISDKIFEIINKNDVTFLASIINKKEQNRQYSTPIDPYLLSFKFLIERFDNFLIGKNEFGMIQIESGNNSLAKNLESSHENFLSDGTDFQNIKRVIESCHFIEGPKNNFAQIADLFINSVFRCVEYHNTICYEKYKTKIYCDANRERFGYGIKYFPVKIPQTEGESDGIVSSLIQIL
jgi:hypothetical protein